MVTLFAKFTVWFTCYSTVVASKPIGWSDLLWCATLNSRSEFCTREKVDQIPLLLLLCYFRRQKTTNYDSNYFGGCACAKYSTTTCLKIVGSSSSEIVSFLTVAPAAAL